MQKHQGLKASVIPRKRVKMLWCKVPRRWEYIISSQAWPQFYIPMSFGINKLCYGIVCPFLFSSFLCAKSIFNWVAPSVVQSLQGRLQHQGNHKLWMKFKTNKTMALGTDGDRETEAEHLKKKTQIFQSNDNSHGFSSRSSNGGLELHLRNELLHFQAFKQANLHDELVNIFVRACKLQ